MTKTEQASPLGVWLRAKRESKGWSVRELAEYANNVCTFGYISRIENSKSPGKKGKFTIPDVYILDKLVETLGESVNEARALADYPPRRDQMTTDETVEKFSYILEKYKHLSPVSQIWVEQLFTQTLDYAAALEKSFTDKAPVENAPVKKAFRNLPTATFEQIREMQKENKKD